MSGEAKDAEGASEGNGGVAPKEAEQASPPSDKAGLPKHAARIRIGSVRIDGFRNLNGVCVRLDPDLTVLLGENNTGKTSLLEVLGVALGDGTATEDDLHLDAQGQRAEAFTVHLTLEPEGAGFDHTPAAVLGDAIFRRPDGSELASVRVTGSPAADGSGIHVRRHFVQGWRGCDSPIDQLKELERPPVNRRVLDLVSFTVLDAKRDLVDDLRRRRSAWGRLLARLDVPDEAQEEIANALTEAGDKVIDASEVLKDLRRSLTGLARPLGSSIDKVELSPVPTRLEEIARALDVLVAARGGAGIPLRLQGMGSRSLAALMVFQAFIETRLGADLGLRPLAVTALEEPEAHLHPQAQGAVTKVIRDLPGQKIVSTHASRIVSSAEVEQVRFLRRERGGITVRSTTRERDHEDAHRLRRLVLRPLGDVLFARLVIIGDGASESEALPVFARAHWGKDPEGMGVTFPELVSLSGNESRALVPALDDFGIPWIAMVDGDADGDTAVRQWSDALGRPLCEKHEVLRLPRLHGFEKLLIGGAAHTRIVEGLEKAYGDDYVAGFATRLGADKTHPKVLLKALKHAKGSYGAPVAEEIVKETDEDGRPRMPDAVRELLRRADAILGGP